MVNMGLDFGFEIVEWWELFYFLWFVFCEFGLVWLIIL